MKCVQILSSSLFYPRKQGDRHSTAPGVGKPQKPQGEGWMGVLDQRFSWPSSGSDSAHRSFSDSSVVQLVTSVWQSIPPTQGHRYVCRTRPYGDDMDASWTGWGGNSVHFIISTGHMQKDVCLPPIKSTQKTGFRHLLLPVSTVLSPLNVVLDIWLS